MTSLSSVDVPLLLPAFDTTDTEVRSNTRLGGNLRLSKKLVENY